MQSAHAVSFFGHAIGSEGFVVQEGAQGSLILNTTWFMLMPSHFYQIYVHITFWVSFPPPFGRKNTPIEHFGQLRCSAVNLF